MSSRPAKDDFLKILKNQLYPELRDKGFRGSGAKLKRVREPFVDCIWLQSSSDGTCCYVNLGVHLTFVPPANAVAASEKLDLRTIDQLACEIKNRLTPETKVDYCWAYGNGGLQTSSSAQDLIKVYWERGATYFQSFSPGPFAMIQPSDVTDWAYHKWQHLFPIWSAPRAALFLARVYAHLDLNEEAADYARAGLPLVETGVPSVKRALEDVLARVAIS